MMSDEARIIKGQVDWAERHVIEFDRSNVCATVDDNLFIPLRPQTEAEFGRGAGDELGRPGAAGSMASLRSSAALAVNFFDPWRGTDLGPLTELIAADRWADRLRFEVTYPTGLKGIPPHLDVVIDQQGHIPVGIESKFTEVYSTAHNEFRPSYFDAPGLWDDMTRTRELAEGIAAGTEHFDTLGAAQLIKHLLGFKREYGVGRFRLLYLWYEWPGEIARRHRAQLSRFSNSIDSELDFAALTYQQLFERLRTVEEPQSGYLAYLEDRYFAGEQPSPRVRSGR
ncbi:MAG: hypothetical protein BMS9Abin17_1333 [Acidimicrobiia bacterium]|nr:MAG: hypothetical protein BMS9Abin17_1333 [Acidimicrobiia bacterium]